MNMNGTNGVSILDVVDVKSFIPNKEQRYLDIYGIHNVVDAHFLSSVPLLLKGEKGTGKTLSVYEWARQRGVPILQFDCSEGTKRFDLIGRFIPIGSEVRYQLGVMPTAVQVANMVGGCVLVFEEINALTPEMQKVLNQLLDFRQHVYIPEISTTFDLKPDKKLLVVGTMNPTTYGGVFPLNEDLQSRFAEIWFGYPTEEQEMKIFEYVFGQQSGDDANLSMFLIKLSGELRELKKSGAITYAPSTRDIHLVWKMYQSYKQMSINKALEYALRHGVSYRYQGDEVNTVKDRIHSVLGVEI
jgi:MoxR-like ATPase